MTTKMDKNFEEGLKEVVDAIILKVERLENICGRYEQALEKVATCKDDDHPVLKLLGTTAFEALKYRIAK